MKVPLSLQQILPYILLIGGLIGVLCSGVLLIEKIQLLTHPTSPLTCDLNPIISCGSVITTPQASVFGFPNPIIGLVGFSVVATIGAALFAGSTFPRWFWLSLQAGVVFGIGLTLWLQFQSLFRIGALCPYCMVVWAVMIPIFWYTTLYNLRMGHVLIPAKLQDIAASAQRHHANVLVVWYVAILGVIMYRFWYYWSSLL